MTRLLPALAVRTRLTLWYSAILLFILVVVAALSYSVLRWSLLQDLDASLLTVAQIVHDTTTAADMSSNDDAEAILRELLGPGFYEFLRFFDPEGRPRQLRPRPRAELPLSQQAYVNAEHGHRTIETLAARSGERVRVLTRPMIAQRVWGLDFDPESNIVDVYVGYLRRKIDADGEPRLLHTLRGAGYRLAAES